MEKHCRDRQIIHFSFSLTRGISLREAKLLKRICRQHRIDLIHAHGSKTHTLAVLSAVFGNIAPVVITRRVAFVVRKNYLTRWKYNHSAIKKIICISETVKQIVRSSINRPERLTVVYSGIDTQRFGTSSGYLVKQYPVAANKLVIGTIAALSDSKDLYTFIDTASLFHTFDIPYHFFIVGEGPERAGLEQYIARKELQQHVTLTGFVNNVPELLPDFDIYLTTAKIEGLGTSVLDAFACHVPMVATRAGGIPEMVIHQKTGLLAEVGDAATLATHLREIAEDSSLRDKLTKAAYQHLLHHFTKEKMAQDTLRVYESVRSSGLEVI